MMFLKGHKTMFLGHFRPFLLIFAPWGFFPKNPALLHTAIYGLLSPCLVSEKNNEPTLRKLSERRKDGRTDRPYSVGIFQPRSRVQKWYTTLWDNISSYILMIIKWFKIWARFIFCHQVFMKLSGIGGKGKKSRFWFNFFHFQIFENCKN